MRKTLKLQQLSSVVAMLFVLSSCNSNYTSKRTGYFRINFPEKKYRLFDDPALPYSFEYPVYANVIQDSTYFDKNPENVYWRNIDFPQFNAKIFLSYKAIGGNALYKVKDPGGKYRDSTAKNVFDNLIKDAFNLTNKNEDVATSQKDSVFTNAAGITGILFKLGGNAATQRQFFMTDTTKNFLRGALYFYASPNADSVKPVLNFLQADIDRLISSFRWRTVRAGDSGAGGK